jgi:deoxycytidine triphosphate deaminase
MPAKDKAVDPTGVIGDRNGVLLNDDIQRMIDEYGLIENANAANIQPASYDIRLGNECYQCGKKVILDRRQNPWLEIPPNDLAFAASIEFVNLPGFIVAHYHLRVGLMYRGLALFGGGQIDPGYRGRIFGVLFNFSDQPIRIGLGEHIGTLEFFYTAAPGSDSRPYLGDYQDSDSLEDVMPAGLTVKSGFLALQEKVESDLRQIGRVQQEIEARLSQYEAKMEGTTDKFFTFIFITLALFALLEIIVAVIALIK